MEFEVSVVMPCLNEEKTIGICVEKAVKALKDNNIHGEVVVADNGSTDNSIKIATEKGARIVHQTKKGYGNAYQKGFEEAKGKYIVMGDSDDTYDFLDIARFVEPLREGYDMVMGSRLKGKILPGAMPKLHQYIGNPVLTKFLNYLFGTKISDSHCGMRSFTKEAYEKMNLKTTGMEFASEMVIKAGENNLKIKEIPITYYPREGESKLSSFKDGWRHVRFMLLYTPLNLFIIPGFFLAYLGALMLIALLSEKFNFFGTLLETNPMLGSILLILGFQVMLFGVSTKIYRNSQDLNGKDKPNGFMNKYFTLERGLTIGSIVAVAGLLIGILPVLSGGGNTLSYIDPTRFAIFGFTFMVLGIQTIFSSFFLSIIGIKHN